MCVEEIISCRRYVVRGILVVLSKFCRVKLLSVGAVMLSVLCQVLFVCWLSNYYLCGSGYLGRCDVMVT